MVAEVVVGVAEALPGFGLGMTEAELAAQVQGALAVGNCPALVPAARVVPADQVEGTSMRRSASRLRYKPSLACWLAGIRSGGTARDSRKSRITWAGARGVPDGSKPRRLT
jgi:hypothetical protein